MKRISFGAYFAYLKEIKEIEMKKSMMVMIAMLFSIIVPALIQSNAGRAQSVQMDKVFIHANDASISLGSTNAIGALISIC